MMIWPRQVTGALSRLPLKAVEHTFSAGVSLEADGISLEISLFLWAMTNHSCIQRTSMSSFTRLLVEWVRISPSNVARSLFRIIIQSVPFCRLLTSALFSMIPASSMLRSSHSGFLAIALSLT